jgi:hypothetical protein
MESLLITWNVTYNGKSQSVFHSSIPWKEQWTIRAWRVIPWTIKTWTIKTWEIVRSVNFNHGQLSYSLGFQ